MKKFNIVGLLLASTLLFSCATNSRKSHEKLRGLVKSQKLSDAEQFVKSDKFFPEKESRLLKYLETGMIQHLNGNYYQSLKTFDKAKELSDKLFTVSISKKLKSAVGNSNLDNYYGEKYERSMIRFYQVLNHYALYYTGNYEQYDIVTKNEKGEKVNKKTIPAKKLTAKQRRFHLSGSKNVLIEWNSLLDNYKSTSGGQVTYKDDLLAKVFGAFIHEQMGTRHDDKVALNLYREARKVLFRNFNILETYNKKSKKFKSDFKKLPNMSKKKVELNYVAKTRFYKSLDTYLADKVKALKKGKKSNVFVLIENGFVTPKKVKKFEFPIPTDSIPASVTNASGFMGFAGKVLKAGKDSIPKIYFEMPEIPYEPVTGEHKILVKSKGKVVAEKGFAVVNPLSNLATMTLSEDVLGLYAKVGARVAVKHVAALATSYMIYESNKSKGDFIAMTLASASYAAANKGIEMSEKADLRVWSTLPHNFRLTSLKLPAGQYDVFLVENNGKKDSEKQLGTLNVDAKKTSLVKFRTY
ncbi:MAG: hypothetical protein BM556_06895 [Bacteriovorax sp. MedPE-SWde]|nr:MAG: hypothetical protein BM556_06895 [Bacteriovorax sp. MedPE-SWde]